MADAEAVTPPARRRLRRDDEGKLIDVVSGQAVGIESLAAAVLDGQRFSVADASRRDVTFSVLRDVAMIVVGVAPSACRQTGVGTLGDMLRSITGAAASPDLFRRFSEDAQ